MSNFSDWTSCATSPGARWTILLSLARSRVGACSGGRTDAAHLAHQRFATLNRRVLEIFQARPCVCILFLAFFGFRARMDVPPWLAAGLALTFWTAAFLSAIWRGCVQSISKGQWGASSSLAMGLPQQMLLRYPPQALRVAIPRRRVDFSVQW